MPLTIKKPRKQKSNAAESIIVSGVFAWIEHFTHKLFWPAVITMGSIILSLVIGSGFNPIITLFGIMFLICQEPPVKDWRHELMKCMKQSSSQENP